MENGINLDTCGVGMPYSIRHGPAPDPRYQSASGLPSYALAPDVRKASKKSFFLDILAPGRAMLHPDGLLGKRSFFVRNKNVVGNKKVKVRQR